MRFVKTRDLWSDWSAIFKSIPFLSFTVQFFSAFGGWHDEGNFVDDDQGDDDQGEILW